MPNYTRDDLVRDYAKAADLSGAEAGRRTDAVLGILVDKIASLEAGESAKISRFFNFHMKKRKAKPGKNPITHEDIIIPATLSLVTKPSQYVRNKMKEKS